MSASVNQSHYFHTKHVVHSQWSAMPEMPWQQQKSITCNACKLTVSIQRTDTCMFGNKDAVNAEKRALQQLKDMGCKHVTVNYGMKSLDPNEIGGGAKRGKSGTSHAKGKK